MVNLVLQQQEVAMSIAILIDTPFLSISEYARRTGQSAKTIRNDMEAGLVPFYQRHRGSKRLVNMVQLLQMANVGANELEPWNNPEEVLRLNS